MSWVPGWTRTPRKQKRSTRASMQSMPCSRTSSRRRRRMDEVTRRTVDLMLGASGMTKGRVDAKRAVLVLRSVGPEDRAEVMQMILDKRRRWLTWLTLTQRQWQGHRRTITPRSCAVRKARWGDKHSDEVILRAEQESVDVRERYVRCNP